jgi:hypothetical protein
MKKLNPQPLSSNEYHTAQSKPDELFNESRRKKRHIRTGMLECNETDTQKKNNR